MINSYVRSNAFTRADALSLVIPKSNVPSAIVSSSALIRPVPSLSARRKASTNEVLVDSNFRDSANISSVSVHAS